LEEKYDPRDLDNCTKKNGVAKMPANQEERVGLDQEMEKRFDITRPL